MAQPWIDLSAYGMSMLVVTIPPRPPLGNRLLMIEGDAGAQADALRELGFIQNSGLWLHPDPARVTIDGMRARFPAAPQVEFDAARFHRDISGAAPAPAARETRPAAPPATAPVLPQDHAQLLGVNRLGQSVYEGANGRFVVSEGSKRATFEADNTGLAPGNFLRATDATQLGVAAEGFVEQASSGRVLRYEDLRRFAAVAFADPAIGDNDPRLLQTHAAIEAAASRWLARKGGRTMAEIFGGAQRLHESMPYMGDLSRHFPGAVTATPQPVSISVQRALGTEADLHGKRVVLTGAGQSFAHLSRGVDLRVFAPDAASIPNLRATLTVAGRMPDALRDGAADYTDADAVVANLRPALLDEPRRYEGGLVVTRADFAEAIDSLLARAPLGRSVLMLREVASPEAAAEFAEVRAWIGARYAIEGNAVLDGSLHVGRPNGDPLNMMVVGRQRPEPLAEAPEVALRVSKIQDFPSLWTWTSQLVYARAKIEEYHAQLEAEASDPQGPPDPTLEENHFQAAYVALSGIGQASTMVPRELEGATRDALSRVGRKHGDVDEWCANALGMTKEQMAERLSPEQVDAFALQMDAEERGRGFLNGDMTGIGKGRFMAAVMLRAALEGKKILFLTGREINLSDIWRDVMHIGAEQEFAPLILNDGAQVVDEATGDTRLRAPRRSEVMEIMNSRQWPEAHNIVLCTYSQFNKPGVAARRGRGGRRRQQAAPPMVAVEIPGPVPEGGEVPTVMMPAPAAAQVEQPGVSAKSAWLRHAIDENTIVILDECHGAAGSSSNIASNVGAALERAGAVVFASATWAKYAKNLGIYKRLFPEGFDTANLAEVMRRGGETIQEVLYTMLAKDGVTIRREHDLSKCDFNVVVDEQFAARNLTYVDQLAPILGEMAFLSGDLDKRVHVQNQAIERQLRQRIQDPRHVEARMRSLQINRMGFGSPLHHMARLCMCALLVDSAAQQAIEVLKRGEKPVILLENTVQAVMQDVLRDNPEGGREPDFRDLLRRTLGQMTKVTRKGRNGSVTTDLAIPDPAAEAAERLVELLVPRIPAVITGADAPEAEMDTEFKATLHNLVIAVSEEMMAQPGADADVVASAIERVNALVDTLPEDPGVAAPTIRKFESLLPEHPARVVARIQSMIDTLPPLPASAIDSIREKILAEGRRLYEAGEIERPWRVEEITGRALECRDGQITRRTPVRKVDVKNRFNAGETDVAIINVSGATGIDLHAGRRFRDQKRRVMIEVQPPADIVNQIQAYGRVNRFDQVVGPEIRTLIAGLPMELRLIAMRNAKLRRLSANTTANREHSALIANIPDLMNRVGDQVCTRYADTRPDLMRRMGFEVDRNLRLEETNIQNEGEAVVEEQRDNSRSANEFLSRLAMLPVAQQRETLDELEAEYRATLQELDARGTNPLKTKSIDGIVHMRERTVFEGADIPDPESEFHRPVFAQRVAVEHTLEPLRADGVMQAYERGLTAIGSANSLDVADLLERSRDRILGTYAPMEMSVDEALAAGEAAGTFRVLRGMNARLESLVGALRTITPGSLVSLSLDGVVEQAVVTRVEVPESRMLHMATHYDVHFAVPGQTKLLTLSMASVLTDPAYKVEEGLQGDQAEEILRRFDTALEGSRLEARTLLTGNDWQAMTLTVQHNLGNMVGFKDANGVHHRGILVGKGHKDLDFLPIAVRGPRMAADLASMDRPAGEKIVLYGNSELHPSGIEIRQMRQAGTFSVALPHVRSRKHGQVYENPAIQALVRDLGQPANNDPDMPKFQLDRQSLELAIGHLMDAGVTLYIGSRHREVANAWMANNHAQTNDEPARAEDDEPRPAPMAA